jgi:hypothetical protein
VLLVAVAHSCGGVRRTLKSRERSQKQQARDVKRQAKKAAAGAMGGQNPSMSKQAAQGRYHDSRDSSDSEEDGSEWSSDGEESPLPAQSRRPVQQQAPKPSAKPKNITYVDESEESSERSCSDESDEELSTESSEAGHTPPRRRHPTQTVADDDDIGDIAGVLNHKGQPAPGVKPKAPIAALDSSLDDATLGIVRYPDDRPGPLSSSIEASSLPPAAYGTQPSYSM